jgi:hypothetical protein
VDELVLDIEGMSDELGELCGKISLTDGEKRDIGGGRGGCKGKGGRHKVLDREGMVGQDCQQKGTPVCSFHHMAHGRRGEVKISKGQCMAF